MKLKPIIFILLILLVVLLSSCADEPSDVVVIQNNEFPIPGSDTAVIHGVLLNRMTNSPVSGMPFLARVLRYDNPDLPIAVSFSLQNDPGAEYDSESGVFFFENIKPGDMNVLILVYGPGNFLVVNDGETDLPLTFTVEGGETLDLGTLLVKE